ncbi:MAG: YIP1 family protein, partial [Cyanobacteria bacterium SZAS TMP-1]|nr:YIP1 family protein [Cyanobacteria bacterium SZAS TMP-1]
KPAEPAPAPAPAPEPEPDAPPMLKLPSKPKHNRGPNLDVSRIQQQQMLQAQQQAQQQQQYPQPQYPPQYPQPQLPQFPPAQPPQQPGPAPAAAPVNPVKSPLYYHPGQAQPGFTPPTQPEPSAEEKAGFVPSDKDVPLPTIQPGQKNTGKPGSPIITSASAKPDWTQPQWPQGKPADNANQAPPTTAPLHRAFAATGNLLPPAIAPVPQAPYSQAPPTVGNFPLNFSQQGQQHGAQSMKQLPFTIKRDFALSKQLFGDQANQPAQERHEYKQTDFIPQAPTLKVAAPDPDRPWTPVPAAQYEFFADEQKAQLNQQSTQAQLNQAAQAKQDLQFARGFNPDNPLGFNQDGQPDPRYSPFQGEVLSDIAKQDKRYGHSEDPIPAEKRERGAAALRALGRNSDRFYENQPNLNPNPSDELPASVRLSSRDLFGLATYYFIVTKEVLTSPQLFFANMSLVGGLNDPLIYLAFTSIMTGLFTAIAKLNPLWLIGSTLSAFLGVAVGAVLVQLTFKKLGGQGKFEQTFNVLAYSQATFLFAWISLGPFPIGALLAGLYTAYLNYLGLSRVHKLPAATTASIIALFTILPWLFFRGFSMK